MVYVRFCYFDRSRKSRRRDSLAERRYRRMDFGSFGKLDNFQIEPQIFEISLLNKKRSRIPSEPAFYDVDFCFVSQWYFL